MNHPQTLHSELIASYRNKAVSELRDGDRVYLIQDTTSLHLSSYVEGGGTLGDGSGYGLYLHNGLLLNHDFIPLSIVHQQVIKREKESLGKKYFRKQRAYEDKESFKWAEGLISGYELSKQSGAQVVHIMDREGDCAHVMRYAREYEQSFIIRSMHDRKTEGDSEFEYLWQNHQYSNHKEIWQKVRDENGNEVMHKCRISWESLQLNEIDFEVTAVYLKSLETGSDIEWLLLTDLCVKDLADAMEVVDAYVHRWLIEDFHKCQKTGCAMEDRRFDDADTYLNTVALLSIHAVKLLRIKELSKVEPEKNIKSSFSEQEQFLLLKLADKHLYPKEASILIPFTAIWFFTILANMGGFRSGKNRKPGWQMIWRGFLKYTDILQGVLIVYNGNKKDVGY